LEPSRTADVRRCRKCDRDVYLCRTPADFVSHGEQGHCVAIPDDMSASPNLRQLGETSPEQVLIEKALVDRGLAWEDLLLRKAGFDTDRIESIREARRRLAEHVLDNYSPEYIALLRMAARSGGVRCPRCGQDLIQDRLGAMISLATRQCLVCGEPMELEFPSE
jgi:hypothetical protein